MSEANKSVLAEQLRLVMKTPMVIYWGAALAVLAAGGVYGELPTPLIAGWLIVMLGWQAARHAIWRRFWTLKSDDEVARWAPRVVASWTVTGILWGLFGASYFLVPEPEYGLFILFIVTTNVAGGAVIVSPYLPAQAGYILGMCIPSTAGLIAHGSRLSLLMAGLNVLYIVVGRTTAHLGAGNVANLIRLQIEKTQLVKDMRRAKESADEASRVKSQFLANMSHELRTPLNAIIGFSAMMREEMFGPIANPRYAGYVGDINDSGRHLLGIVNDVLDLSKLEAGGMKLAEETVDPAALARECTTLVASLAAANDIQIAVETPPEPIELRGDALRLKQVMLNLLSNAVKFSRDGGEVSLTERLAADGAFVISVKDQGIGMDKAGVAKALQPFGQVENSWTRRHMGTGLGLPLAKWLAELHGGKLEIDSVLELGTTVRVILPASRVIRRAPEPVPLLAAS